MCNFRLHKKSYHVSCKNGSDGDANILESRRILKGNRSVPPQLLILQILALLLLLLRSAKVPLVLQATF